MPDYVLFDQPQAVRIGAAVRDVESRVRGGSAGRQGRPIPVRPEGTPFVWTDGTNSPLPPFGVFCEQPGGDMLVVPRGVWPIQGIQAAGTSASPPFWVNRSQQIPYFGGGLADLAVEFPVRALCDSSGPVPSPGQIWGPKPGSFKLWPGYPGFLVLDVDTATGTVLVLAQAASCLRPFELTADHVPGPYSGSTPKTLIGVLLDTGATYGTETAQTFYWIPDQATPVNVATLGVGRARSLSHGYYGTRGLVKWNPSGSTVSGDPNYPNLGRFEIVWGDFSLLATVQVGTSPIAACITGSPVPSGQAELFWETNDWVDSTHAISLCNPTPTALPANSWVTAYYDRADDLWYAIIGASSVVSYGVAQADWVNAGGNGSYVSVKACKRDGSSVTGSAFNVYLPRSGSQDPQVYASYSGSPSYAGDIIEYQSDLSGNAVATGSYLGPKIGTIALWSGSVASIPYGWCLCDGSNGSPDLRTRFVMGADPANSDGAGDEALGSTGGYRWHGTTENGHGVHASHLHKMTSGAQIASGAPGFYSSNTTLEYDAAGNAYPGWTHGGSANGENDTDNRPLYFAIAFMIRYK